MQRASCPAPRLGMHEVLVKPSLSMKPNWKAPLILTTLLPVPSCTHPQDKEAFVLQLPFQDLIRTLRGRQWQGTALKLATIMMLLPLLTLWRRLPSAPPYLKLYGRSPTLIPHYPSTEAALLGGETAFAFKSELLSPGAGRQTRPSVTGNLSNSACPVFLL